MRSCRGAVLPSAAFLNLSKPLPKAYQLSSKVSADTAAAANVAVATTTTGPRRRDAAISARVASASFAPFHRFLVHPLHELGDCTASANKVRVARVDVRQLDLDEILDHNLRRSHGPFEKIGHHFHHPIAKDGEAR